MMLCVLGTGATPVSSTSDETIAPACRFLLYEEQVERQEIALDLDLAQSESAAAQEIFTLLDKLWKNDAVERLLYLAGKHDRDVTRLDVERKQMLLERQDALIEHYSLLCEAATSEDSENQRGAVDEAFLRYRQADCTVRAREIAMAEVELEYAREVLVSYRDLREHDVASRQQIIFAERDFEMAQKRLAQSKARHEQCRREPTPQADPG